MTIRYSSICTPALIFRVQGPDRMYGIRLYDNPGDEGNHYVVQLFRRDPDGYRHILAEGTAPHGELSERWAEGGPWHDRTVWTHDHGRPANVEVTARGALLTVGVNGKRVCEARDTTYAFGRVGLYAIGYVSFENLQVTGTPAKKYRMPRPRKSRPHAVLPFAGKLGDNENSPKVVCTAAGTIYVTSPMLDCNWKALGHGLATSRDGGRTWDEPVLMKAGGFCSPWKMAACAN